MLVFLSSSLCLPCLLCLPSSLPGSHASLGPSLGFPSAPFASLPLGLVFPGRASHPVLAQERCQRDRPHHVARQDHGAVARRALGSRSLSGTTSWTTSRARDNAQQRRGTVFAVGQSLEFESCLHANAQRTQKRVAKYAGAPGLIDPGRAHRLHHREIRRAPEATQSSLLLRRCSASASALQPRPMSARVSSSALIGIPINSECTAETAAGLSGPKSPAPCRARLSPS